MQDSPFRCGQTFNKLYKLIFFTVYGETFDEGGIQKNVSSEANKSVKKQVILS